ncbi:serine hydrolase domain-containing protein [Luteimonas sp. TWI1416]|uniref:serine hydrolase domain-containing protein n=1 Tax=unclassified Luteimonas TaxID=2629088 RepID=UPI003209F0AA
MPRTLLAAIAAFLLSAAALASAPGQDTTTEALARLQAASTAAESDALLIVHDGRVLVDTATDPARAPIELMSATKSVVALGVGLLLADGKLDSLDTPVHTFFPEWAQGRKRDITVRMLLDHTSGLQNVPNAGEELEPAPDIVQLALAAELDAAPGETFSYNNKATNLLSGVISRASGMPMDAYLQSRLFDPLDIHPGSWLKDPAGNPWAMAGLSVTASDAAKLGQLLLDDGVTPDGTRLLPEGFVQALYSAGPRSPRVGLLWWRIPEWQFLTVREDAIATARARDADPRWISALESLRGQRLDGAAGLRKALGDALGDDWPVLYSAQITGRGLARADVFDEDTGPVVAYAADGFLGQYIVVVPDKRLVAVRQIRRRDTPHAPALDYPRFTADVVALAATL